MRIITNAIQSLCLLVVVGLAGCSPSINPAMKASVDQKVTAIVMSPSVYGADFPAMGYAPGSWLKYKTVDEKGHPSIVTYKLISLEGNLFTIESVIESYYSKMATYMEFVYQVGSPLNTLQVQRVVTQTDGGSPVISSPMEMSMLGDMYREVAGQLFILEQNAGTSSTQVPAGQFSGCLEKDSMIRFGPWSYRSHSWHHRAVPMHGMVRSERSDGKPGLTELLSFGTSGARSEVMAAMTR